MAISMTVRKAMELRKAFLQTSVGQTLGAKWEQGMVELSNTLYNANGQLTIPTVVSSAQLETEHERDMKQMDATQRAPRRERDHGQEL